MKRDIKCLVCGTVLGSIEKDVISDRDIEEYQAMEICPNGHTGTAIELNPADES